MCAIMGVSEKTFYLHQRGKGRKTTKLQKVLKEGRALAVATCARTVMECVQGRLGAEVVEKDGRKELVPLKSWNKKQELQLQAALKYLGLHGDEWKPAPQTMNLQGHVQHKGKLTVDVEGIFDEDTALRMSAAFLRSRGVTTGQLPEAEA
jgi:hypothetical protein